MMDKEQYAREKALFLYISAIERNDTEQMQRIFKQAETDFTLMQMIDEAHAVMLDESEEPYLTKVPAMEKAHTIVTKALDGHHE